jgi:hypothetical protein
MVLTLSMVFCSHPQMICRPGSFSLPGALLCSACPPGHACPDTTSAGSICSAGTYSMGSQTACTVCPPGYLCPDPTAEPQPCPDGTWSDAGAYNCSLCPPAHECAHSDRRPAPCPVGFWSAGGTRFCSACQDGFRCSFPATEPAPEKDRCPPGGYCSPASRFVPCPAGSFANISGASSLADCHVCPAGYFCLQETASFAPNLCPRGYFCPQGTRYALQYPCPGGTYNDQDGSQSQEACKPCAPGYYCPMASTSFNLQICPAGRYCLLGTYLVTPAAMLILELTAASVLACSECPPLQGAAVCGPLT